MTLNSLSLRQCKFWYFLICFSLRYLTSGLTYFEIMYFVIFTPSNKNVSYSVRDLRRARLIHAQTTSNLFCSFSLKSIFLVTRNTAQFTHSFRTFQLVFLFQQVSMWIPLFFWSQSLLIPESSHETKFLPAHFIMLSVCEVFWRVPLPFS